MERRKIQRVGASTLTISLPREWIAECDLKKGDEVLLRQDGIRLELTPPEILEERRRRSDTQIVEADRCDAPGLVERLLIGHYVLGRHRIVVRSDGTLRPAHLEEVWATSRRLMGLGIIEESPGRVVLQCSIDPANYPLPTLLRRLHDLGDTMLREATEALVTGDRRLAQDALRREDDADMMYWLLVRLAVSAFLDGSLLEPLGLQSRLEILGFRVTARDLEAVADYCEDMARAVLALLDAKATLSPEFTRQIAELSATASDACNKAVSALLTGDIRLANEAIQLRKPVLQRGAEAIRVIHRDYGDPRTLTLLISVVESIQEISFAAKAIAAVAFNRHLETPSDFSRPAG